MFDTLLLGHLGAWGTFLIGVWPLPGSNSHHQRLQSRKLEAQKGILGAALYAV